MNNSKFYQVETKVKLVKQNLNTLIQNEKERLGNLNTQLKNYLTKVKQLENANSKLLQEITLYKNKVISNNVVKKTRLQEGLEYVRHELNQKTEQSALVNIKIKNQINKARWYEERTRLLEDDKTKNQVKINVLHNMKDSFASEKSQLVQKVAEMKDLVDKHKLESESKFSILTKLNDDYDKECMKRLQTQLKIQTLIEDYNFQHEIHQVLKKDLVDLVEFTRDCFDEEKYRAEIARVITELRNDFEMNRKVNKQSLEEFYHRKLEEVTVKLNEQDEFLNERIKLKKECETLKQVMERNARVIEEEKKRTEILESKLKQFGSSLSSNHGNVEKRLIEQDEIIENLKNSIRELDETTTLRKVHVTSELQIYKFILDRVTSLIDEVKPSREVEIPIIKEENSMTSDDEFISAKSEDTEKVEFNLVNFEDFLRNKFMSSPNHGQKCTFNLKSSSVEDMSGSNDTLNQTYEDLFIR